MAENTTVDVIWGAKAIAQTLNLTDRAVYHMLEAGTLPGAKKIGGKWAFSPSMFAAAMREAAA